VKIVLHKEDLKDIDGKIIVTPMTSIRFVPFLHKVKAIITDEGGIACHAAIIAREMKIPCVIGTGNATKILKDGDLVEIDTEKGIVKKL
jgi:pyruvate,water dikinase